MHQESATALMPTPRPRSAAAALSVVIIRPGGLLPPCARPIEARVATDLAEVHVTDDVVILAGRDAGGLLAQLVARLGARTPPVLVIAPALDLADVRMAFEYGVTGYLLEGECPPHMDWVIRDTAARLSWLSPGAASALISRVRKARREPPAALPELTPRETQIMALIADGHAPAEIADRLRLREKTVRNNLSSVYAKLQVRGMTEAIIVWLGGDRDA
jgi:DNA-binding NarL/FixJ family response regulator